MRYLPHRVLLAALLLTSLSAWTQTHKVAKPEQVVRAIGVFEWTGDFAKPAASRLIPVSLFIDGKLEDAGIYVARPVPFAILSGNVYELQTAGIGKGILDLAYARHLQATTSTGDLAFDDGWFGYGSVKPLAAPRKTAALKPSKTLPVLTSTKDTSHAAGTKTSGDTASNPKPDASSTSSDPDRPTMKRRSDSSSPGTSTPDTTAKSSPPTDDPDRPTMKRRSSDTDTTTASTGSSTGTTPSDDPDRPTMKRRDSSDSSTPSNTTTDPSSGTSSKTSARADDPDRPTMKRRSSDSSTTDTASTTPSDSPAADDPDRPTLKRHSAADTKKSHDTNSVIGTGSLNDDPNRPNLHRGKPTSAMTETDLPKLTGLPENLHQMVAVSDAANRDPHPFTLEWEDPAQHAAVLEKMQAMARAQLAAYTTTPNATPPPSAPATAKKATPAAARPHRTTAAAKTPPPVLLSDEEVKAYTLSYGGASTYVYSAHTAGTGAALRYVTIVAQDNGLGELKPAIQNVTDAAHLDRTPRMRFVDVVDAEASNRASLLFELRSQNARQFGLYRVIASHSEQIFLTGTTQ